MYHRNGLWSVNIDTFILSTLLVISHNMYVPNSCEMNFGLHMLDQKYFVRFDEMLTLHMVTMQLEVYVWVKCQGWWSFLFPYFMHFLFCPSQTHVRTIKILINFMFPQIEVNPRFSLHFVPLTVESYLFFVFTRCLYETPSLFCCWSDLANHRLRQIFTSDMAICVSRKLVVGGFCTEVFLMKQNAKHL